MKKIFWAVFFCFCIFKNVHAAQINYGADKIITRALVAKMIAFINSDRQEIFDLYKSRSINFIDTDREKWYDKYINAACKKNLMSGFENKFAPDEPLTLIQAQYLLDKINPQNDIKIKMTDENKNKNISYSLWLKLFSDAIKTLHTNVEQKKIIALATPLQNKNIPQNNIVSNENYYSHEGIEFDFFDKQIEVLLKGKEILAILNYNDEFELDCTVIKNIGKKVFISVGPVKRFFVSDVKKILPGNYRLQIKAGKIINAQSIPLAMYNEIIPGNPKIADVIPLKKFIPI